MVASLNFVTDRSQEGAQFVKGFGGFLRYVVNFAELGDMLEVDENDDEAWI